jgi:pimeloyl-ACP methyl ester carboxylesterase
MTTALAGCARLGEAPVPIAFQTIPATCAAPVDTLIVLLPGAFDRPEDFVAEGFVDALKSRGIAADVALVDATIPYYREQLIVPRLDADVIGPARARGIRHIWLAGISLGGLGSLIYANEGRESVDGLLLMAPYLGERATVAEVAASGGLASWAPPGRIPDDDFDRRIWQVAKKLTVGRDAHTPQVFLGFGVDDRFVTAHRLLAAALPRDHVFTAPGGHDWPAWRAVWSAMLDAAPLPRTCKESS